MKTSTRLGLVFSALLAGSSLAQVAGNAVYGQNGYNASNAKGRAEQAERELQRMQDTPPSENSMFLQASVMMNVKADEYVAVFGLEQEAPTIAETQSKMDAKVKQFSLVVKQLGVSADSLFVDFITQPKVYSYEVANDAARERLSGFELKKNISVRYTNRDLLDRLIAAAASAQIYDLIKVDYVVRDPTAIEATLRAEAAGIVKAKGAQYEKLLGIKTEPPAVIYAEHTAIHYPTELYDSYKAAESESLSRRGRSDNYTVISARKGDTFYFNGLDANGFDKVINPVILEPVVQFTFYLKVKYDVAR